ncbi:CHAT domain-containing protein [Kribbella sindirgiensis]|uniref:CHAT domain-containing protein n=1 Tax=Kribbella sindirgiensis TaxID=1124744 RepID=A0A4R0IP44_9ACTN|nr:CHAT domain-containing protein [Kribbella sindirgiensis]TCC34729.1 CHAT domain-containing protein [Kribbella sindirgiensis]
MDADELHALALSRPADALKIARQVLANSPSDADAAAAHKAAGVVHRDFGDIDEAVTELKAAYRHARKAADPDGEADILASLGVALVMAGQTRRGLSVLDSIVPGRTGVLAGRILIRRIWVRGALLGRYAEALADAEQAVELLTGTGDLMWEARALTHRAMVLLAMGAIERADVDYARSEELFAKCGQQVEYADTRQARGAAAFARGDLPTALLYLDDAQRVVDELGVLEPDLFANKCVVLLAAGLTRDALTEINSALERFEHQRGSTARRAELLYCAGLAAHAAGALELAESRSRAAMKLFRRQQRPWWAARAELVLLQSRYAAGERTPRLLHAGQRLSTELDGLDADLATEAHLLTGRLALARSESAEARRHLSIAAAARNRGLRARGAGWLAQATLHHSDGRARAMLAACRQGLSLIEVYMHTLGATELRVLATAQGAELAAIALRYAVQRGNARQVLEWSERWRSTVLAIPPVRPQEDDGLVADLTALRSLTYRLETSYDQRLGPAPLHRERRRLEAAVRRRVLVTPGTIGDRPDQFRSADLLAHLGDRSLIELTDVDDQLYAITAARGRVHLASIGPTQEATRRLSHALFALRREATGRGEDRLDLDAIGARLETALLGDVAKHLADGPVVVVPTGRLHAVPWSLLPSLRHRPTSVAPSAAAWLRARSAVPPATERVVLIGGPQLSTGPEEVRRLSELYPDAVVLTEGGATAEAVLEAMDGASLVHVAAHGTFRADSPLFSSLQVDDGPLTVYDLERLDRAPHRVVLSSCSSALGGPSGADELLGLVSALVALGSSGVVASVVPVNDPATVPLMLGLHDRLRAGDDLAEALAQARVSAGDDRPARTAGQSFIALGA